MRIPRFHLLVGAFAVAACLLAGCGSSGKSKAAAPSKGHPTAHGKVQVLYAGSLEDLMNDKVAPAFAQATGYSFSGFPAGSKDLAAEIKSKVRVGDVFISAAPKVDKTLEGPANGNWVSWYAPFATTQLVLGYNKSSRFARDLRTMPWFKVITKPGFRLGFTDPKLDPKGVLAVEALESAAKADNEPALMKIASDQSDLFPEQDLVGRLQTGQLDAGFFYTVEANAAKIPTVPLQGIDEHATYTITVLNHAPDQAAAEAFAKFLLGARGQALLRSVSLSLMSPHPIGTGVPAGLRAHFASGG